jgi:hypothetical protein
MSSPPPSNPARRRSRKGERQLVAATLVYGLIYYFKDARTGQTVITSILEASPALMRAIVLSSLFLRVFIQLQLWHGVVFGIVRHQRIVMQVCSRGNNRICLSIIPY